MALYSATHVGKSFEMWSLRLCNEFLMMDLRHVGGRGDGGVDLRGYWWLPKTPARRRIPRASPSLIQSGQPSRSDTLGTESLGATANGLTSLPDDLRVSAPGLSRDGTPSRRITPLRVLAQCKAEKKPGGPRWVREMEGVVSHMVPDDVPPRNRDIPSIGLLLSQSGFSHASLLHASSSRLPLLLIHLQDGLPDDNHGGTPPSSVKGLWWNRPFTALLPPDIELGQDRDGLLGVRYAGRPMMRYGPPGVDSSTN